MKAGEKRKAEFLKTKKNQMFRRKEYKCAKKGKVLGFATSTGKKLFVRCPSPWNATAFSKLVRRRVGPFFQASFPDRARIRILLDSEPLLHTSEATEALAEFGIEAMPGWPKYSPDLNPQENVWSWVERTLRREEKKADTFADFSRRVLRVAQRYPSADSLIPSMHRRVQEVLKSRGAMTR